MKLIDVDYALQQIEMGEMENGGCFTTDSSRIKDFLNVLPTVDAVEVVHGRWIKEKLVGCEPFYLCSVCEKIHDQDYNYCNNCGARMDGGNTNE